jgi:hypothetical protein
MKCRVLLMVAALVLLGTLAPAQNPPAREEPLVDQVRKAIDKGIRYLREQQRPNGSWEQRLTAVQHPGGSTSLALLALLNAGVPVNDPMIRNGLNYLRALEKPTTYVRSLQTMVFAEVVLTGDKQDLGHIQKNVDHLIDKWIMQDGRLLGWSYEFSGGGGVNRADNSNTQYAVLGLYHGKLGGATIAPKVWESIRDLYARTQNEDGGWSYAPGSDVGPGNTKGSYLPMTTAGLCGLVIAAMELNPAREQLLDNGTATNCGNYKESEKIQKAVQWVAAGLKFEFPTSTFYNLYGIERAGRLSGLRFFGEHDWYREGCEFLAKKQHANGSWSTSGGVHGMDADPVIATSFSLLFLSKGRTPVLISKLVHRPAPPAADDLDWNNDRNDIRHLTDFASKEMFKKLPLAWQIFDAQRALRPRAGARDVTEAELLEVTSDLLQSPILYFNGHKSPLLRFTEREKDLIKRYVENGGFILAEACCGDARFDKGFRALVKELWPDSPLEKVPAEHPIWGPSPFIVQHGSYPLEGIQLGCKWVVIYSPKDLSCKWETGKWDEKNPKDGRIIEAYRLGGNIIAYATGMEPPRPRLSRLELASAKDDPRSIPRGYLTVAQLEIPGEPPPAPQAMRNLMVKLREVAGIDVALKTENMPVFTKSLRDFKFVYMHGRKDFEYPAERELEYLRFNLENGGLLLADACCGKEAFDKAFRKFVKQLLPKHDLRPISGGDELFSKELNGVALTEQVLRSRRQRGEEYRNYPPELEGIKINDRWVVIYSKYDLGCALERHKSSDCLGYDFDSAWRLAGAAVLYSLRP